MADTALTVLSLSEQLASEFYHSHYTPSHMLWSVLDEVIALDNLEALLAPDVGFSQSTLRRLPLALYGIIEWRNNFNSKGEIEERLKSIKAYSGKAILFIDKIHILLDEKGPVGTGVVNLLKPELARGEITVIGATTQNEFQKYIEKDAAFNRRFTKITISEPDELLAIQMLNGLIYKYEEFHLHFVNNVRK